MGIQGLNKLIKQYAPDSFTEKNIEEFKGSKIAIDSEILIYKYRAKENGTSKNSHIHGFIQNIFWYIKNGITPVYIFDGVPSAAKKKNALTKRQDQKNKLFQQIEKLENKFIEQLEKIDENTQDVEGTSVLSPEMNETLDNLFKLQRRFRCMNVTRNHRHECKYLLKLLGIPFLNAEEDAEALCINLQREGKVDYVYTEDSDAMTYLAANYKINKQGECPKILKKGSTVNTVVVIDLKNILEKFEMTPETFIDMCILSGCDFCSGIPKIGPINAHKNMKKYGSIEKFISETGVKVPETFKYEEARHIFNKNYLRETEKSFEIGAVNIEDFKKYLINERSLNPHPILSEYNSQLELYHYYKNKHSSVSSSKEQDGFSSPSSTNKKLGGGDLITGVVGFGL